MSTKNDKCKLPKGTDRDIDYGTKQTPFPVYNNDERVNKANERLRMQTLYGERIIDVRIRANTLENNYDSEKSEH